MSQAVAGTGRRKFLRGMPSEIRALLRNVQASGWQVSVSGGNHLKLKHPSGRTITMAATPSDWRAFANARATLRRELRELPA
jgi:predicted RNA binding protein YcfA (HicA-like mRNA interferase family)